MFFVTYKPNKNADQLYDVSEGYGEESTNHGVDDGYSSWDDDGDTVAQVEDHRQCGTWGNNQNWNYSYVITSVMACQISGVSIVAQPFVQGHRVEENIKAPRHWPLWGEFTVDQWITKGQWRGWWRHHEMEDLPLW